MGKDERFHRSLKAEALSGPPFHSLEAAAQKLSQWRMVYNLERPHEAIGMKVPAERYTDIAFRPAAADGNYDVYCRHQRIAQFDIAKATAQC
jgi:transposase InsO family protein